jgi:hypothetical protein
VRPQGLGKLIKVNYRIGSRTRDLPASSIVSQPLRYRVSSYAGVLPPKREVLFKIFLIKRAVNATARSVPLLLQQKVFLRNFNSGVKYAATATSSMRQRRRRAKVNVTWGGGVSRYSVCVRRPQRFVWLTDSCY